MNGAQTINFDEKDFAFCLGDGQGNPVWQIYVNDRVVPADFNSKGAAIAGIAVQLRRDERRAQILHDEQWPTLTTPT